uniref:Uncharacterized protein n=1 Tax=Salix viminalis TaxID=40686 RepID=A0A6N2LLX3_SALVM
MVPVVLLGVLCLDFNIFERSVVELLYSGDCDGVMRGSASCEQNEILNFHEFSVRETLQSLNRGHKASFFRFTEL